MKRALLATFLLLASCVSKPTMHLNHAMVSGAQIGLQPNGTPNIAVTMTVVIDVYNPNGYDVAVRAFRGEAIFADVYPLPIAYQAPTPVWMPAGQTTALSIPVEMPMQLAVTLLQQSINSATIPYRFIGTADVIGTRTFQIEKDNYGVDERGEITRAQIAAIVPNTLLQPFQPPQQTWP